MTHPVKQPPPPSHGPEGMNLIECGDDGWRPWSMVCKHLCDGESTVWKPIESTNPYVEYDWCCPECEELLDKKNAGDNSIDMIPLLEAVCVICVCRLRKDLDPNYHHQMSKN